MTLSRIIRTLFFFAVASYGVVAQTSDSTQTTDSQRVVPPPAYGQTAPILSPENPPLSGLDQPSLELRTASRSFISPGLQVSESADSNINNNLNASAVKSATRVLGAFDLQKFWSRTDLLAEYLGGGVFYNTGHDSVRQMQALAAMYVSRWRTGQISFRDSFSYLPEGSFSVGAFGGAPGLGLARGGVGAGMPGGGIPGQNPTGITAFPAVGLVPRISNLAIADVVQSLTPRSALTVAGGYSTAHFLDNNPNYINSRQITAQGGYSYMLTRRNQIAAVYGFQEFIFPVATGGKIDSHVMNVRLGRTLSNRMSIQIGAGPQYTRIYKPGISIDSRISLAARARLLYKFPKTSLGASYEKYTSSGSGFFAGADTQVARFSVHRPFGRTWEGFADAGFSYHKRLQNQSFGGATGDHYNDLFVGAAIRKQVGRNFGVFADARFTNLSFSQQQNLNDAGIGKTSRRWVGAIGVDWHPRPIRIE